jgi:predicted Zn-dependent protease
MIDEKAKRYPRKTFIQSSWVPQVRAAIAIKRNNPAAAIEALKPADPMESNDVGPTFYRGIAYLNMKSAKEAAAEFKKIEERKYSFPLLPIHVIGQLELARALALSGDTAGARTGYQDLFAQWKDGDPNFAPLKQAKDEYSRLH